MQASNTGPSQDGGIDVRGDKSALKGVPIFFSTYLQTCPETAFPMKICKQLCMAEKHDRPLFRLKHKRKKTNVLVGWRDVRVAMREIRTGNDFTDEPKLSQRHLNYVDVLFIFFV